jgi:succinate dehydrogenase / fumarate reductase flavoprotein subunit
MELNARIPDGPIAEKWDRHRFEMKLVNPANKRKFKVIVVGTGLAGGSAAATLAELGYHVECFCFQDSPRRAHSIAAQGGINAAKNYQNDGDSIYRLFYDTVKGGDFRAREANVYRLAQVSVNIIDQCVAQGVPFAREYGGTLEQPLLRRRPGLAHLLRPRPDRPAAAARRLPGARAPDRPRHGQDVPAHRDARPRRHRRPRPRHRRPRPADRRDRAPTPATRWCSPPAATATSSSCRPTPRAATSPRPSAPTSGRRLRQPLLHADPPDLHPGLGSYQSKLTLMSESLRNDGRVWVPKQKGGDSRRPQDIPEAERDYYLERRYPSFGNLVPRDVASRAAKQACDEGRGVGPSGLAVYLDFADAIKRLGRRSSPTATATCSRCTSASPARTPTRRRCASTPPSTTRWAGCGSTTT